ncbi:hypothetical protein F4804DRAFT_213418 [Jackrogersella minutella]|nr:hypothetical protein F4804DRAFT_213418 [Jackrogersella minutella]
MVNGAEYTVKAFIRNPDSVVYMVEPGIFIVSGPPEVILVSSPTTQDLQFEGLEKGLLPLFPSKVYASKENKSFVRTRPFDREGFTLTPTFAITEFKAQGQTLPEAYLSITPRSYNRKFADFMATYVQLSRVASLQGLQLLSPIDKEHWTTLRLPHRMQGGIDRLVKLDEQVVNDYNNKVSVFGYP